MCKKITQPGPRAVVKKTPTNSPTLTPPTPTKLPTQNPTKQPTFDAPHTNLTREDAPDATIDIEDLIKETDRMLVRILCHLQQDVVF
jgi:hypothetical protein